MRENATHWLAEMVAPKCDKGVGSRASFVASDFDIEDTNGPGILKTSALGLYRAFINGQRVGDDLLTPGLTCYDDRISFLTYDISSLLSQGKNRIEIWLTDGWYRSQIMWEENKILNCWGDRIAAIAQIECGDEIVAKSDANWQSGLLPITASGIYFGEDYDARLDVLEPSSDVEVLDFDLSLLVPHEAEPVRALTPLDPVDRWRDEKGAFLFDFGQNCAAQIRIVVRGDAGAKVRIEHSEILGPGKAFDNRNYRSARGEARYSLKGEGEELYQPYFTFMGFRYARVTLEDNVEILSIQSVPVSSVPEVTAGFECGVESVNRLVWNTIWSQRSNFIEIPTDCPQRDERLGWTGDAQVFAGTACWLADSERFLYKFLADVMHDQRPNGAVPHFSPDPTRLHPDSVEGDWAGSTGWGDVIVLMPWQLYLHYGNTEKLRHHLPAMRKWVDYLWALNDGPIIHPSSVWGGHGFSFGDWLQPVGDNRKPRPTIADDCAATLYHYISTQLTGRVAKLLGEDEIAKGIFERADIIKDAFVREYFSSTGRLAHNDQTSYALAFLYDLVPAVHFEAAKAYFRRVIEDANYLIGTGFIGTPVLLPALTKVGMMDVAEKLFLNPKVPGWLYQVNMGATSIWERWDALGPNGEVYDPDMNSYNHYAYGAVCQWLFEDIAGVKPDADLPAFKRVHLNPHILPALGEVSMWHQSRQGRIEASWKVEDGRVTYRIALPEGCEGVLAQKESHANLAISGRPVEFSGPELVLDAGEYEITFDL